MKHKRSLMSIAMAALVLVSLLAAGSSAASASGQASGTTAPLSTNLVGGPMKGTGPAVALWGATNNAYVFVTDSSGSVWFTTTWGSGNGMWQSIGGVSTASPAAVSWNAPNLRLDIFVRGADGALWWKYYQNKAWYSWQSLGGKLAGGTGPAVASWSAGRLDVFVEGTTGALYHKWYSGATWSGWQNLGGKLTASPAATSPFTVGVIDVFVRGGNGAVWQKTWNVTAWSSWKSLGGKAAANTRPAVTSFYGLFVQGLNHQLWQMHYGGRATWSAFNVEPEALSAASPGAVCTDANMHPLVAVSRTSGEIWWSVRDVLGHWDYWYSVGSPP